MDDVIRNRMIRNFTEVQVMLKTVGYFKFWRSLWLLVLVLRDCVLLIGWKETIKALCEGKDKQCY